MNEGRIKENIMLSGELPDIIGEATLAFSDSIRL